VATLSTLPTLPVPNRDLRVVFTLLGAGSNFVRVWCTNAPPGSELRKKIDDSTQNRVEVHAGDGGDNNPWLTQLDLGGAYTFVNQEYIKGAAAYGGGYEGAPASYPTETKNGDESTVTLQVMKRLTFPLGTGPDRATLVVWSNFGFVRPTTLATHGEESPVIKDPTSDRMRTLAETAAVRTAVDALASTAAGQPWDTVISANPQLLFSEFRAPINAHLTQAGVHANNDGDNDMAIAWNTAASGADLVAGVNLLLKLMRQHRTNDAVEGGTVSGVGSGDYHENPGSGLNKADLENAALVQSVGTPGEAYAALGDIWRAHEAHRIDTDYHTAADNTNALTAFGSLPLLLQLHVRIFQALATLSPSVPTENDGVAKALGVGFEESPL